MPVSFINAPQPGLERVDARSISNSTNKEPGIGQQLLGALAHGVGSGLSSVIGDAAASAFKDNSITPFEQAQLDIEKSKLAQGHSEFSDRLGLDKSKLDEEAKNNTIGHSEFQDRLGLDKTRVGLDKDKLDQDALSDARRYSEYQDKLKQQESVLNQKGDYLPEKDSMGNMYTFDPKSGQYTKFQPPEAEDPLKKHAAVAFDAMVKDMQRKKGNIKPVQETAKPEPDAPIPMSSEAQQWLQDERMGRHSTASPTSMKDFINAKKSDLVPTVQRDPKSVIYRNLQSVNN